MSTEKPPQKPDNMSAEKAVDHVEDSSQRSSEGGHLEEVLGYKPELKRNRSLLTLLFQSLAIAAIPYGEGSALMSAIYGGGQLSIFLGWFIGNGLTQATAMSLGELASRYPTSGGPSYWSFQVAGRGPKATIAAFVTGWVFLIGNVTITLSVNFGFASLLSATISMFHPDFLLNAWQLLLVFWAVCLLSLIICAFCNRWLPHVDTFCSAFIAVTIIVLLIALPAKADVGRHSAAYALGHYDTSFSGWGGFTFFIGLLPATYCFSAVGMISSMAEECADPAIKVPRALAYSVPVGFTAGLFFVIPITVTLPPLAEIINEAPAAQALPYIFNRVMGGPGGAIGPMILILTITLFCSISITNAASRTTWAFARDDAVPGAKLFAKVNKKLGIPFNALALITVVQMLLGFINLGSTSAFTAFVSVGVQALALSYAVPIACSLFSGRKEVNQARWTMGPVVGAIVNSISLVWIAFELVLFSMPTALPVTAVTMNYASVVLLGFGTIAVIWYAVHSRKAYKGPPASEGL